MGGSTGLANSEGCQEERSAPGLVCNTCYLGHTTPSAFRVVSHERTVPIDLTECAREWALLTVNQARRVMVHPGSWRPTTDKGRVNSSLVFIAGHNPQQPLHVRNIRIPNRQVRGAAWGFVEGGEGWNYDML